MSSNSKGFQANQQTSNLPRKRTYNDMQNNLNATPIKTVATVKKRAPHKDDI